MQGNVCFCSHHSYDTVDTCLLLAFYLLLPQVLRSVIVSSKTLLLCLVCFCNIFIFAGVFVSCSAFDL